MRRDFLYAKIYITFDRREPDKLWKIRLEMSDDAMSVTDECFRSKPAGMIATCARYARRVYEKAIERF